MPDSDARPAATKPRAEDVASLPTAYRSRILDLEAENDRLRAQLQAQARKFTRLAALLAEAEADYARARHLGD
jgi:hypothetical protein